MNGALTLEVEDFTGQIRRRAKNVHRDEQVGDFVTNVVQQLHLPDIDASGRPVRYGARTHRGDALNYTDRVGDVLEEGDVITLTKNVTAG
jgi:hypothetical protein